MPNTAIRVEDLSKLYRIDAADHAPRNLRRTAKSIMAFAVAAYSVWARDSWWKRS